MFDKTYSNEKMSYATIVDLAEMIKLGIQSFFHLRSFSVSFEQVSPSQIWSNEKTTL